MIQNPDEAKRQATELARRKGLSVVAAAKMREAVDDLRMRFLSRATFRCIVKQGVAIRNKPRMDAKTDRLVRYNELVEGEMFIHWVKMDNCSWVPRKANGSEILQLTEIFELDEGCENQGFENRPRLTEVPKLDMSVDTSVD